MIIYPDLDLRIWEVSNSCETLPEESYYTKAQIDSKLRTLSGNLESDISAATSGKQDTLVSGETIKTINGESLLGSGNIEISGGGGVTSGEVEEMISEATSGLPTTSEVTEEIAAATSGLPTTSEMTTAINEATSGKVDTTAITANYYDKTAIDAADEVVAQALNTLNNVTATHTSQLGGFTLVSMTKAQFDQITPQNNVIYFVRES